MMSVLPRKLAASWGNAYSNENKFMTLKTDNSHHYTRDSNATGTDAPRVDIRQTNETFQGSQAKTDASFVDKQPNGRGDNPTDTKRRPRRKTNPPPSEVRPQTTTLRPKTECCAYLYNLVHTKFLSSWTHVPYRAPYLKMNRVAFLHPFPPLC